MPKKQIQIQSNKAKDEIKKYFDVSINYFEAYVRLYPYAALWWICLSLGNHYIERILKAMIIWKKKIIIHEHDLIKLCDEIEFLEIDDVHMNMLKKINQYFNFRYPDYHRSLQNVLDEIGEELIPGIPRLADEIGTEDLDEICTLGNYIIKQMPTELRKVYDHIYASYDRGMDIRKLNNRSNKEIYNKIELCEASVDEMSVIQNMARFYAYDLSKSCGFYDLFDWAFPSNGLYQGLDLSDYWKPNHYAFIVKIDGELAGFVLIDKIGTTSDVEWNMGQFFIVGKYQAKGIGRQVAIKIFDKFPGIWEVAQMPDNIPAIKFWENVISIYTKNNFQKDKKVIQEPKPHENIILKFVAKAAN